jgi:thiamine biosynthesis lipoprotein
MVNGFLNPDRPLIIKLKIVYLNFKDICIKCGFERNNKSEAKLMTVKYSKIIAVLVFVLMAVGCSFKKETLYSGKTMGTIYNIKVVTWFFKPPENLKEKIDIRLNEIESRMSTFNKTSEISRFNEDHTDHLFPVSDDFIQVMTVAAQIYTLTKGAWDGTINPLVDLWGFGGKNSEKKIPAKEKIEERMKDVGFHNIEIAKNKYLVKKNPLVSLDLASIAKWYAVDKIAQLIVENSIENFLVEIGGEVYAKGLRKDGENWRIGVNLPQSGVSYDQVYKVVPLQARALATSGDYRNFFEAGEKRYSHVIDPNTGFPVDNGVVSVSIVAPSCAFADGLATAVMVMGQKKGLELVNKLKNVECLVVVQEGNNNLVDYVSKGFFNNI